MRLGAFLMGFFYVGAAVAGETTYLSMDGGVFELRKNSHGAVLTSVDPDDGPVISTTKPRLEPGDVLYLGRSCDAFTETLGEGTWRWTDGGFLAEFPGANLAFPGQQIKVSDAESCRIAG